MRDFLPADVRRREYVIGRIKEVYERYGFEPLETPAVENIETLMGKYGEEGHQLIFKILKRGVHESTREADLALRYDLTVPLARVVAEYKDKLPKFFKRYQIQPVWRADRPARGRFREFYQCDVDVLGSKSMVVEAEICAAVTDVLNQLKFNDFSLRLNHRSVLTSVLNAVGIPESKHADALVAIDKLDKRGEEGVRLELQDRGIEAERLMEFVRFILRAKREAEISGGDEPEGRDLIKYNSTLIDYLHNRVGDDEQGATGLKDLTSIIKLTNRNSAGARIQIDPSLARGLSYYTGPIMEIRASGMEGSLGGGGRYDNLVGMFLGENIPACGFSLGLERIIVVMTERGMFPPDLVSSPADVMVTIWNEDSVSESIALAHELRKTKMPNPSDKPLRVDLYPEPDKLGKQFKYASSRGIRFVAVLGDDERARGEVAIKDMRSGEQRSVKRDEVAGAIRAALDHGQPAGRAGDSIKPGVERSETPGSENN